MGPVEQAIRMHIRPHMSLRTPTRRKPFRVDKIDSLGLVLLLGEQETPTRLTWECLEGVVPYVSGHGGSVRIGGVFDTRGASGTLDLYLKQFIKRTTAGWVAAVFAAAGLLEVEETRPARVRLPRASGRNAG